MRGDRTKKLIKMATFPRKQSDEECAVCNSDTEIILNDQYLLDNNKKALSAVPNRPDWSIL